MSPGVDIVKPIGVLLTSAPVLTANPRPYHIALDWSLPPALQSALGNVARFNIYRCGPGSGDCTPTTLLTNVPGSQFSLADADVQPGQTYCYAVTYLYDDCEGGLTESPLSNIACGQICTNGCPQPEILITGNDWGEGSSGNGPIETYDFSDGSLVHLFVPQSVGSFNGRALAIYRTTTVTNLYYTEASPGTGDGDGKIHVCSYGTEGSGATTDSGYLSSPDSRTDPNTGNLVGIQDLALHIDPQTGSNELFVLSGYGSAQPKIFEVDPVTGNTVANGSVPSGGVLVQNPASEDSDGFTVLTNATDGRLYFLINEGDHSPFYDEYDTAGHCVSGNPPYLNLMNFDSSFTFVTGVTSAPDDQSLYFMVNSGSESPVLLQIAWPGLNQIRSQQIVRPLYGIEDIDVLILQ